MGQDYKGISLDAKWVKGANYIRNDPFKQHQSKPDPVIELVVTCNCGCNESSTYRFDAERLHESFKQATGADPQELFELKKK